MFCHIVVATMTLINK